MIESVCFGLPQCTCTCVNFDTCLFPRTLSGSGCVNSDTWLFPRTLSGSGWTFRGTREAPLPPGPEGLGRDFRDPEGLSEGLGRDPSLGPGGLSGSRGTFRGTREAPLPPGRRDSGGTREGLSGPPRDLFGDPGPRGTSSGTFGTPEGLFEGLLGPPRDSSGLGQGPCPGHALRAIRAIKTQ